MKYFFTICFILVFVPLFGQRTLFVKDQFTKEAIPFVKVRPDKGNPVIADIDGAFILDPTVQSLDLRAYSFVDTIIDVSSIIDSIIYMRPVVQEVQEVVVVPGENPAHRIINEAIRRRKENDPLRNDAFRYESYSKFIFDINRSVLDSIPKETTDTNLIDLRNFFNSQYLFMLESATTRTFIPPDKDKEEITAYKVSGFKNPLFSTFANEMQSFSFYDDQFQILGTSYINPISPGSTRKYLFILEDTTIVNTDTTYTIFYRPRKKKNFDGMTGHLYINTNGFAIEKVIASPHKNNNFSRISIIQEYTLVNENKWFPLKLSTEIDFTGMQIKTDMPNSYVQGKGNTYIRNIEINPGGLKKRGYNNITTVTADDAAYVDDETWDSLRVYKINELEERTYEAIDSLSEAEHLEEKLDKVTSLLDGKLTLGKFNLDLTRILNYDYYEGYRLGAGLETSDRLMRNIILGSYFGWGTRDKDFKYGGYSTFHFSRKKGIKLKLSYQQDVLERGGTIYRDQEFSLSSPLLLRHFFIQNMEKQRLGEIVFSFNLKPNIRFSLIGNYQRLWYTNDYRYSTDSDFSGILPEDIDVAETGIEVVWNIREKIMLIGNKRISKGTKYPKIHLQAIKGWKGWFESELDYYRFSAEINHSISLRGVGKLIWNLSASQTVGDVPLFLMQRGNGTSKNWNLSVINTFETMGPSEFFNSRQAALYTRFLFTPIRTKAKWNEPQFGLHHAIGYGDMTNKSMHNIEFSSMDKGFYETGLLLNNLYVSGFSGLGVGIFYRYGNYSDSDWKLNIVPKISLSITL